MKILKAGTYYGQEVSFLHQTGILLSEYQYLSPRTEWHYHENPYFMYILQGQLMDISNSGKTACPRGSLIFYNWQEPHQNTRESSQARGFHIEFERSWFDKRKLKRDLWEGSMLMDDPRTYQVFAGIYYEFHCRDAFTPLSLETLMLQLCGVIDENETHDAESRPAWVGKLKSMVWEEKAALTLENLSAELGLHPVYLSRAIPKYLGTTVGDYIRRTRVRKSLELLSDPNFSLTEIAHCCGFSDQSHYNRTFAKYLSVSPGAYRRRITDRRSAG